MIRDTAGESALDVAVKRLERAVALLEQDLSRKTASAGAEAGHASDQDRARLASELDQARARERDLEEAGAQASAALGRAIAEIKSVLNGHAPAPSPEA
jgi:hypothetical protein